MCLYANNLLMVDDPNFTARHSRDIQVLDQATYIFEIVILNSFVFVGLFATKLFERKRFQDVTYKQCNGNS